MALFRDPIRTLSFELASGWAYDQLYSTLTDYSFARWDNPDEMLVVHLRRACVAAEAPDEEWLEKIRQEVGEGKTLFDINACSGRAVGADFVSSEKLTQRVAFLRGPHVDIAVEQRNADMKAPEPWSALTRVIETAASEANQPQSGEFSPVEFNRTIDAANKAFEKKDYDGVSQALEDAIRIGTTAWLNSLKSSDGAPEINAAVRVAQAMMHLGHFSGKALLLGDAASILRRALCSLESAGRASDDDVQGLVSELKEILDSIQSELLEEADPKVAQDSAPIITSRERGFRAAQASAMAFDASDFDIAAEYAEAAVADFLFLLAYFRRGRSFEIPDEILRHLADQGISDHEEQRDTIQKVREGMLFPALNLSLQIGYCCAIERKNPEAALEAVELYLPLARQVKETSVPDTSIVLNLVLALMDTVGAIAALQDGERLREGTRLLDEAIQLLDETGDKQCQDDGWVRNYGQQADKSLQVLNQWLGSCDSSTEPVLKELTSKFEAAVERIRGKITRAPESKPESEENPDPSAP